MGENVIRPSVAYVQLTEVVHTLPAFIWVGREQRRSLVLLLIYRDGEPCGHFQSVEVASELRLRVMDIPALTYFDAHRLGTDDEDPREARGVTYMEVKSRAGARG